jgi:hypothetical protein
MKSRPMINSFTSLISELNSPIVKKFLNESIYLPEVLKDPFLIQWQKGKGEIVFPSNKSIIDEDDIIKGINKIYG